MKPRRNILVTGANGQLGMELRRLAADRPERFVFTDVSRSKGLETVYLDITNPEAVALIARSEHIDAVINCAGYTDVENAEKDAAMADLLNHVAPGQLASLAAKENILLIHISTDYVFQGDRSEPLREDWPAAPLGVYGVSKWQGERAVLESGCRSMIFRTAWLYSPYGRNFVKTMLELTRTRPELKVVSDQVGTPTYAVGLAALLLRAASGEGEERTGLYHYSDEGVCSWYDLACAVKELGGGTAKILPCRSEDYPSQVRRPHYSVLDKTLVKKTFGLEIPHWRDNLRLCMERLCR